MNILVISTILPIPGVRKANDFIFQTFGIYQGIYKDDKIVIISPVKCNLNPISLIRGKSLRKMLNNKFQLHLNNFQVEVFPYVSSWRSRNLHSIVTRSIYWLNKRRIQDLFAATKFDIIHSRFLFADGMLTYMLSKKYGIPYMINTHNERFYFDHFFSRKTALRILNNASKVSPLNYSNYLYFKSLGVNNLERSTHGFNKNFIKKQKPETQQGVSIFTVAELIKLKNIDKVIHAIDVLVKKYNITYTIIGSGPEKDKLLNQVESLGLSHCINFREYIPHEHIAEEMYKHDIFIMPSYFETFGRVYFEVMAMGIPIICAKNSGIFGIFKDGEEGIAVDHTRLEDIIKALEILVTDSQKRLQIGRNGQKLVANFTWENVIKDLHAKYLNIIA